MCLNASAGRIYRLALTGHTLVQVGTDGGLFEKPVELKEILLTTGERVELLVRGTDPPAGHFDAVSPPPCAKTKRAAEANVMHVMHVIKPYFLIRILS